MSSMKCSSLTVLLLLRLATSSVSMEERRGKYRDDFIFRKLQQLANDLSTIKKRPTSAAMQTLVVTKKNTCRCNGATSSCSSKTFYSREKHRNGTVVYSLTQSTARDHCRGDSQTSPVLPEYRIHSVAAQPVLLSVLVDWSIPDYRPDNVLAYIISYSVNHSRPVVAVATVPQYLISQLQPNTVISNVTVYATTTEGPGPVNSMDTHKTTMGYSPKVQNVRAEVLSSSAILVSWDRLPVQLDLDYLVHYGRSDETNFTNYVSTSESSATIRDLISGKEYVFEVVAMVMIKGFTITGLPSDRVVGVVALPLPSPSNQSRGASNNGAVAGLSVVIVLLIFGGVATLLGLVVYWLICRKKTDILHRKRRTRHTRKQESWFTRQKAANWLTRQKARWSSRWSSRKSTAKSSLEAHSQEGLLETPQESSDTEQEIGVSIQFVNETVPQKSLNYQENTQSQ